VVAVAPNYESFSKGNWRFAVLSGSWNQELQDLILGLAERQPSSKHPQTLQFRYPESKQGSLFYLKIFHWAGGLAAIKDLFRYSKAFRSLCQTVALSRAGFDVPTTIAAGEFRRFGILSRAFVVTPEIRGQSAPLFLLNCHALGPPVLPLAKKRDSLMRLAETIRRLHRMGFVHGDLVPSNIFISETDGGSLRFYLMDNDRTRRYPCWFPQALWKRNLVQLNRFPLPGISLQDRMRFFRRYLGRDELRVADRRLLRWLEMKTRERRQECDHVDATLEFRKLMRWAENKATKV